MRAKSIYAIAGLLISAATNILYNLIAAAIQQQAFSDHFSKQSLWWLVGFAAVQALLGWWLGGEIPSPSLVSTRPTPNDGAETVTTTRLLALLSGIKLRGKGIHIKNTHVIGSKIDIDTKD